MEFKYLILGLLMIISGSFFAYKNLFYKVYDDPMIAGEKAKKFFSALGLIILGIIPVISEIFK